MGGTIGTRLSNSSAVGFRVDSFAGTSEETTVTVAVPAAQSSLIGVSGVGGLARCGWSQETVGEPPDTKQVDWRQSPKTSGSEP